MTMWECLHGLSKDYYNEPMRGLGTVREREDGGCKKDKMKRCDIVFMSNAALGKTVSPGEGSCMPPGSPVPFGPTAARCSAKSLAVVTRPAKSEPYLPEPFKSAGSHVYGQTASVSGCLGIVCPRGDVDDGRLSLFSSAGYFQIADSPAVEPCIVHLGGYQLRVYHWINRRTERARIPFGSRCNLPGEPDHAAKAAHLQENRKKRK